MKAFLSACLLVVFTRAVCGQEIAGIWQGKIKDDKEEMRLVVKIVQDKGALSGELYSIDEDGDPIALSSVSRHGDTLTFAVALAAISFSGRFSDNSNSIVGTWIEDKKPQALTLLRANKETAWDIPKPTEMMAKEADPSFEVATIKPSKPDEDGNDFSLDGRNFSTQGTTLDDLIGYACDLHRTQIVAAPSWAESSRFDIAGVPDHPGEPNYNQTKSMMRKLLSDRFQLRYHMEKKEIPVYVLSVAKDGPKHLTKSAGPDTGFSIPIESTRGGLKINVLNGTMTNFAIFGLHGVMDRPMVDRTGLADRYDFSMSWLPDLSQFGGKMQMPAFKNPQPDIFAAAREQLGLQLRSARAEVDVMVIDHVEMPSPN